MSDLTERLRKGHLAGEWPYNGEVCHMRDAEEAADELDRLTTIEAAVREVIRLVNVYLPPDTEMSKDEFISEVIGAVDNEAGFKALRLNEDRDHKAL